MSTPYAIALAVMLVIFLIWCFAMGRMLWRLTRRSIDRLDQTGSGYFKWLGHSLTAFRDFALSEDDKRERRRLIVLTALLFVTIIALPYIALSGS